jgi:hypothetical protein
MSSHSSRFGQGVPGLRTLTSREVAQAVDVIDLLLYPSDGPTLHKCLALRGETYRRVIHPVCMPTRAGTFRYVPISRLGGVPALNRRQAATPYRKLIGDKVEDGTWPIGSLDPGTATAILRRIRTTGPWMLYTLEEQRAAPGDPSAYECTTAAFLAVVRQECYEGPTVAWSSAGGSVEAFIFTHPDALSTYVGGTSDAVCDVVTSPELDVIEVDGDTPIDTIRE